MADNDNPVEAGQFLGDDGVFAEDWLKVAFDEDDPLRQDRTLGNIKDIRTLAKQVVSGESTIGKLSGGRKFTFLLDENSTDEEKKEHYTAIGRPDKAEGYELDRIDVPQGVPKDDKFIAKMSQVLFDGGAPKSLSQSLVKGYMEYTAELLETMATEDKLANTTADQQLHTLLGSAYDEKMKSAFYAIEALALPIDAEFAETLKKELPYDPAAAQLFIKMGEMISSDKGLKGVPPKPDTFTPGDARAKANEVMANPYYVTEQPTDKPRNVELHNQLIEEVKKLLETANE